MFSETLSQAKWYFALRYAADTPASGRGRQYCQLVAQQPLPPTRSAILRAKLILGACILYGFWLTPATITIGTPIVMLYLRGKYFEIAIISQRQKVFTV